MEKTGKNEFKRRKFLKRVAAAGAAVLGTLFAGKFAGGMGEVSACIRPPGALPEKEFLSACTGCGRCVRGAMRLYGNANGPGGAYAVSAGPFQL